MIMMFMMRMTMIIMMMMVMVMMMMVMTRAKVSNVHVTCKASNIKGCSKAEIRVHCLVCTLHRAILCNAVHYSSLKHSAKPKHSAINIFCQR